MIWFSSRSLGRKADIHRSELLVRRLQVDHRHLRLRRQIVLHLRDLGLNLGQRRVGVVVQLQVNDNRAQALGAGRLHVVDAVGAGDHALQRRGDESAHQVGIRADVHRGDLNEGNVAAGILPDAQRADRLKAGDQNDED